ncbi:peptidoglycan-binding protein [Phormidium tenue FACHB-886]|nr:peptidoglycan-binding protein [Phormidium tenue FACHB-886]
MTAFQSTTILKKGSQGIEVKRLQAKLNAWLRSKQQPPVLVEDGIFGAATEGIVKYFQCHHFLEIDGVVGATTQACLERGVSSLPTLKQGDTGPLVRRLQSVLEIYGIKVGVDGIYGAKTRAAVMRFQNDFHLFDPNGNATGEVNLVIWKKLAEEPVAMACGPLHRR